jgi:DNA invertase Pin-like site-specific DNA recombinase
MQSTHSADDQTRECRAYAERQGWVVVIVERDEAVRAGALAARDGYARLIKAAKNHEFDVLLVEEISRFSRDFLGGMVELRDFDKLGVRIADTKNGILDLTTAAGQMQTAVSLMMSHQETQRLGERSKRGLRGKVLAKFSGGGRPAFGMRRVPVFSENETDVDGRPKRIGVRIEPDPQTAHIVERIFREYCEGQSKRAIALKLNSEGVASRDAGGVHAGRKNNGTWTAASIKKIVENEIYVGDRVWNKHSRKGDKLPSGKKAMRPNPREQWERIEGYATPIIDRETWARAQHRSEQTRQEHARDGNASKHTQYLLSGMIVCA